MGLESLLKPVRWVDEQILRQYTKLTKKWEDKGRSRYSLAMMCNAPTWVTSYWAPAGEYNFFITPFLRGYDTGQNIVGLISGKHFRGIKEEDGKFVVTGPLAYNMEKIIKAIRSPIFLAGTSLIAKTGYNLYNYWKNGEQMDPECFKHFMLGVSFLGLSSSVYIKDSEAKLLDKEPFTKKAYKWLKEKVSALIPRPLPQPVPAKAN